jgi:hypothetical protein
VVKRARAPRRWLCVLALAAAQAAGAEAISVRVEPETVVLDRSFHLLFETDHEVRADPDLSPLESDFDVVAQTRTRVQARGRRDLPARSSWRIELMPTRAGTFTVPAIAFGSLRSRPLRITVQRAAAAETASEPADFVVAMEVDAQRPRAQQQIVLRVLHATGMTSSMLSEPEPEGVDTLMRVLDPGRYLDQPVIQAGKRYRVYEQRYAVFPQTPGTLVVPPVRMEARTRERARSRGTGITVVTRHIEARSPAVRIPVLPAPAAAARPWLPARSLTLRDAWQPANGVRLAVGDTLTRRISVEARGLTAAQLPELAFDVPEGIELYAGKAQLQDRTDASGVTGTRTQTFTLAPSRPGRHTLPAVALAWWNTDSRRAERATLAPRTLEVVAATGAEAGTAGPTRDGGVVSANDALAAWQWASGALALAWLLTLWRWHAARSRQGSTTLATGPRRQADGRRAMAALESACTRHDARAARCALLAWAAAVWPRTPPTGLSQIARGQDDDAAAALHELQRALYARDAPSWDGSRLRARARRLRPPPPPQRDQGGAALAPLHPHRQRDTRMRDGPSVGYDAPRRQS